jgi:hypothetical protein
MGWHEYNFNALWRTEISRYYDANNGERATNIDHPSVYEIVDQMFYYLSKNSEISKCLASTTSILPLIRFLFHWHTQESPEKIYLHYC